MKLLTFTTLYPNAVQPSLGIFVETRAAHLVAAGAVSTTVVAPIPYAADIALVPRQYRKLGSVPFREERRGLSIVHPRYIAIPKVGMTIAPFLLYLAAKRCIEALIERGLTFDLIDAHYFYPDGVAAALLARHFCKPFVVTARGTDINLIPQLRIPRAMIRWAAREASGIIAVCAALKEAMVKLDVPAEKIRVLRNGVDLSLFRPTERVAARAQLEFTAPTLLSVGHLIERKGHDLVIGALALLQDWHLVIIGDGPEDKNLRQLAVDLGVAARVRFLGAVPQTALPPLYGAADILVLASSREGWANVLLEAMACGTPVVASNVWGTPEVVASPAVGELMDERTPAAIARAVTEITARTIMRPAVRAYAEGFSWDATTWGQEDLFDEILRNSASARDGSAKQGLGF